MFSECFDLHLATAITGPSPCSFPAYTSGDNGNVYTIVNNRDNTRTQSFTYDHLNRLSSAQSSGSQWGENFTIDPWGNLTNETAITGKTNHEGLNISALTNNQLSGFGYDAAGNMTSNTPFTYVYDAENRLIAAGGMSYIYDGDGYRVEKCTQGTTPGTCASSATGTLYWRGISDGPEAETDLSGNVLENYIFFGGQRLARRDAATKAVHFYFSDHLGSHAIVENATGTSCEQDIDYYPFGGVEQDYCPNVPQNYKFTGKERDAESGLDNFEARYLGSSLGRFMSPDPMGGHQEDPQTLNKYAYVRNNPTTLTDPTGLDFNLNCDKNNGTTCQGGHQYYQDKNGDYKETVVKSDDKGNLTDQSSNKYHAEVDGQGVHFSQDGSKTSSLGTWVNGSNETKFTQTSGALAGFSFDFHQTSKEQTANGTFYYPGAPRDAYDAVLKAGFSASMADDFFNPLHGYIGSYHYRSDGDPGTGKNSGHLIMRGVTILHPWDTVPTNGELHFGETNPNVNRIEHFRKDVF